MIRFKKSLAMVATTMGIVAMVVPAMASAASNLPKITPGSKAIFTIGSNTVIVNGQSFSMDVAPYIDSNGRTMVPVRYLAEITGAYNINWNPNTQVVNLFYNDPGVSITMWVGKETLVAGANQETMDTVPAIAPPGRTMLPARYVAQSEGYTVGWNASTQQVTITASTGSQGSNNGPPPGFQDPTNTSPPTNSTPGNGIVVNP